MKMYYHPWVQVREATPGAKERALPSRGYPRDGRDDVEKAATFGYRVFDEKAHAKEPPTCSLLPKSHDRTESSRPMSGEKS